MEEFLDLTEINKDVLQELNDLIGCNQKITLFYKNDYSKERGGRIYLEIASKNKNGKELFYKVGFNKLLFKLEDFLEFDIAEYNNQNLRDLHKIIENHFNLLSYERLNNIIPNKQELTKKKKI